MRKLKSAISMLTIMAVSINLSVFPIEAKTITDVDHYNLIIKYYDNADKDTAYKNIIEKYDNVKFDIIDNYKDNMDLVEVNGNNVESVISDLESDENVEFVQQDYVVNCENNYNTVTPNDNYFSYQWGLKNNGQQIGNYGIKDVDINVLPAWNYTKGSDEVVIGVLDSGIYINHEDLHDNIFVNKSEIPNNNIDDDKNGYIDDVNGWDFINNDNTVYDSFSEDLHGTFVAGIIAASSNNIGICGVAPNVKIMPMKFISVTQGHTSDAIRAIEYAETMGVDIINCSWGGMEYNKALKTAMKRSHILFVCASGNEGYNLDETPSYPACFNINNIISVGAIDNMGVYQTFSNYGENVDVAAPGLNIISTIPLNGYTFGSGTSFAAPFVTGVAALVKSRDESANYKDMKKLITKNVVVDDGLVGKVRFDGRVDAFKALSDMKLKNEK